MDITPSAPAGTPHRGSSAARLSRRVALGLGAALSVLVLTTQLLGTHAEASATSPMVWALGASSANGSALAQGFTDSPASIASETTFGGVSVTDAAVMPDGSVWELGTTSSSTVLAHYASLGSTGNTVPLATMSVPTGYSAVAADPGGDLWVLDGAELFDLTSSDLGTGTVPSTPAMVLPVSATALAFSPSGALAFWSWDGHAVSVLSGSDVAGDMVTPVNITIPNGEFSTAATWGPKGTLWVAGTPDWSAPSHLYAYSNGDPLTSTASPSSTTPVAANAVDGIGTDDAGNVWLAGTNGHVYEESVAGTSTTLAYDSGYVGGPFARYAPQQILTAPPAAPASTPTTPSLPTGTTGSDLANASLGAGPAYSVFNGWESTSEPANFRSLTGQPTTWAMDFIQGDTWANIARTASQFPAAWTSSGVSNMIWGVPMDPTSFSPAQSDAAFRDILAGDEDSVFTATADGIAASFPHAIIRLAWEFNGNWFPWSASEAEASDFVAAWQHIVTVMRAAHPGFTYLWNPTRGAVDDANLVDFYPGNAYVDEVGLDVYDDEWGTYPGITEEWQNMQSQPFGLNWLAGFAAANGKRIVLPEWGLGTTGTSATTPGAAVTASGEADGGDDGAFITDMLGWIQAHDALGSFWQYGSSLSSTTQPDAVAAFRFFFTDPAPPTTAPPTTAPPTTAPPTTAPPTTAPPTTAPPTTAPPTTAPPTTTPPTTTPPTTTPPTTTPPTTTPPTTTPPTTTPPTTTPPTTTPPTTTTAPVFTEDSPPEAIVGIPYRYTFSATGSPAPTFIRSRGSLPVGLQLNGATISGTPHAKGTAKFVIQASNSAGSVTTPLLLLPIAHPQKPSPHVDVPKFISARPPAATVGVPYRFTFTVQSAGRVTFNRAWGQLPAGLHMQGGTLSGTPSGGRRVRFVVRATNSAGSAVTPWLTIPVRLRGGSEADGTPTAKMVLLANVTTVSSWLGLTPSGIAYRKP